MASEFEIVFALFPRITQLDFTGPFEVFWRLPGAHCVLASVEGGAIQADGGITFSGVVKLADVSGCSLLCVPGGFGTVAALGDREFLAEIGRLGTRARYVTSVCTGSLLLAAAGLLRGRRAACHWAWRNQLSSFGVTPDPARVVRDGNIITGGGVTAGIDMALTVMAEIAGIDYAQAVQSSLEYAPEPPFDSGRPERARPEVVAAVQERLAAAAPERAAAVDRAARLVVGHH
ncbi:MAG TPA: DJ-1/PfpI family protein [Steroidobacteraceae bacterium]|jgi:transcriptional regulator GlxA family with amidase domain|nr:DJ-1/PfpI family protein [Steroidobacteraceae bacterium]